jgi:hypothetical protein
MLLPDGENYAATWREPDSVLVTGKVTLGNHALHLDGTGRDGRLARRAIAYTDIAGVRIGRETDELLQSQRTLVLERTTGPPLLLDVIGPGMLFELAEVLATISAERKDSFERVVLVVPLDHDAIEAARARLAAGPTFDPAEHGLERHEVFLTDEEAVFVFEGQHANEIVQQLLGDRDVFSAALEWQPLMSAAPRLARSVYAWRR